MRRTSLAGMDCSIARTLDVVGEWWTMLIIRDAFKGVTRYEDFHRNLGIARTVLSTRLERLIDEGLMVPRQYSEHPPRSEYLLTEKGRDLFPVIVALIGWGDRWAAGEGGPPVRLVHDPCGHPTRPEYHCDRCGGALGPENTHPEMNERAPSP
jgi:DNA-binding HxlR family transcriptional regulator